MLLTWLGNPPARAFQAPPAEEISVVQFNTWGVPFATYDHWRFAESMDEISALAPDVVFLNEVFTPKARRRFQDAGLYPYGVDGPRAFPKLISSGLRILSRHPIERTATLVYNGCVKDDCLARKGALLAIVRLPSGRKVTLVATHLNARGDDSVRAGQVEQLVDFVTEYREAGAPLLIAGDFNFAPDSTVYPRLIGSFGLDDAWTATHGPDEPGYTSDCARNEYAHEYATRFDFPLVRERIDYLLSQGLAPTESRLLFDQGTLYSDHYGLQARYRIPASTAATDESKLEAALPGASASE